MRAARASPASEWSPPPPPNRSCAPRGSNAASPSSAVRITPRGRSGDAELVATAARRGPLVVDLAYASLCGSARAAEIEAAAAGAWRLYSPNKAFGLTGVRGAYLIAPRTVRRLGDEAPSWVIGRDAVAMLETAPRAVGACVAGESIPRLWRWRAQLAEGLRRLRRTVRESPATFLLVDVGDGTRIARQLRAAGIRVRDARSFGLGRWIRLSAQPAPARKALLARSRNVCERSDGHGSRRDGDQTGRLDHFDQRSRAVAGESAEPPHQRPADDRRMQPRRRPERWHPTAARRRAHRAQSVPRRTTPAPVTDVPSAPPRFPAPAHRVCERRAAESPRARAAAAGCSPRPGADRARAPCAAARARSAARAANFSSSRQFTAARAIGPERGSFMMLSVRSRSPWPPTQASAMSARPSICSAPVINTQADQNDRRAEQRRQPRYRQGDAPERGSEHEPDDGIARQRETDLARFGRRLDTQRQARQELHRHQRAASRPDERLGALPLIKAARRLRLRRRSPCGRAARMRGRSMGTAIAAPVPSPRRMPSSSSGRACSAASSAACPGSRERCEYSHQASAPGRNCRAISAAAVADEAVDQRRQPHLRAAHVGSREGCNLEAAEPAQDLRCAAERSRVVRERAADDRGFARHSARIETRTRAGKRLGLRLQQCAGERRGGSRVADADLTADVELCVGGNRTLDALAGRHREPRRAAPRSLPRPARS